MVLNKEDREMLLADPDRFLLSAYLSFAPEASVSDCMKIIGKSRGKTFAILCEIRGFVNAKMNGKMNAEMNGKMNAENRINKELKAVSVNAKMNGEMNDIDTRKNAFAVSLQEYTEDQPNPNSVQQYPRSMVRDFYVYWSEKDRAGKKMRFEREKTWELPLRLSRWASNNFQKKEQAHPSTKKIATNGY